jgi:dipeptidyl aminopeptidase/acylaminoacyl peptidase
MYEVPATGGTAKLLIGIDPATTVDFHAPSWLANGDLLYLVHWKSERDSTGQALPDVKVFDGRKQIPVQVDVEGGNGAPVVAPSGEMLFLRTGANAGIWSVPYDMTRRRATAAAVLVAPDAVSVSVAADGSLLYVESAEGEETRELIWADRSGKVLAQVGTPHSGLDLPALSPDGRRVAFRARQDDRNSDIWVLDLARGTETRLTFGPGLKDVPEWLPSSNRLAYVDAVNVQGRILAVNADGSGDQREIAPLAGLGAATRNLSVAPDGKTAVRIVDERGRGRLRIADVGPDGVLGPLRPLLKQQPEPDINDAIISPDGRLLAYVTNNPGQVELFLTRYPGGDGQWQVGSEGGRSPQWSGDGKELFFVSGSGPSRRTLVAVHVDPAQEPPVGAMQSLFATSGSIGSDINLYDRGRFAVSPDGQRFLFTRAAHGSQALQKRMVLVENWRGALQKPAAR